MKQKMIDGITAQVGGKIPTLAIILLNAKAEILPLTYVVIPSVISCFTTFYCFNPYFILIITLFSFLL